MRKIISLLLVITIILSCFSAFLAHGEGTSFNIYKETKETAKSTVTVEAGNSIEVQVKTNTDITKFGIDIKSKCLENKATIKVYNWNKNVRDSKTEGPIAEITYTAWERNSTLSIDLTKLSGGALPAGEYIFELMVYNENAQFYWYKPSRTGVCGYLNEYIYYGAPQGFIETKVPCEDPFENLSTQKDFPYNTAAPEYVIPEDSAISVLNIDSTQWNCVDGLGRTITSYQEAGNKNDKKVGIFYWTWHYNFANNKPVNVQKILEEYPEAINDYHHKIWSSNQAGAYFWNEPIWGYYQESDDYVLRKHAELLADAGVDFVMFDCTNGDYTWESAYLNLLKVWSQAREDGVKTPQISFMLPFGGGGDDTLSSLKQIYNAIYKEGKYQDLWFYWDGKPLVMAGSSCLDTTIMEEEEIYNFFTFRQGVPSYFEDDRTDDYWGWLHIYPQALYKNDDGTVEMTTVGVAMNANYETMQCDSMNSGKNMGRSYTRDPNYSYTFTYRGEKIVCTSNMENSKYYGLNFQEQWDYAISVDPEIIFVTGWNEWIAGRNEKWGSAENGFPDQCNDENSRDTEPTKGELKDYYYYQLCSNIRKFKGASVPVSQTKSKTIDINGDITQWEDSNIVEYNHYANNTYVRDNKGWGGTVYKNDGIRNDFVQAKVSYDKDNIYFYVETACDITPYTDENWMRLLLDTQVATEGSTDWEEFEFIVGRETGTSSTLTLEKSTGGWNWEKVCDVSYVVKGNVMQLSIPRSSLGLTDKKFSFNFKWADFNLEDGDIMSLYTDGDCAPGGRFTFAFNTVKTKVIRDGCKSSLSYSSVIVIMITLSIVVLFIKRKRFSK